MNFLRLLMGIPFGLFWILLGVLVGGAIGYGLAEWLAIQAETWTDAVWFGLVIGGAAFGGLIGIYLALYHSIIEPASISDPSADDELIDPLP